MFLQCPAQVSAVSGSVVRWVVPGVVCDLSAMSCCRTSLEVVVPDLFVHFCRHFAHSHSMLFRTQCEQSAVDMYSCFPLSHFSCDVKQV